LGNMEHGYINYTISIYIKDGRYKYIISDFYHTGQNSVYLGSVNKVPDYGVCEGMINYKPTFWDPINIKKTINSILSQIDSNIVDLVKNLKFVMDTNTTNTKTEEW